MLQLNYRDTRPIYEQIIDHYRHAILSGEMKAHEKLPSVRSLASSLSINPNTIQRSYLELENSGYIYSVPGKGSFVSELTRRDENRIRELTEKVSSLVGELRVLGVTEEELTDIIRKKEDL